MCSDQKILLHFKDSITDKDTFIRKIMKHKQEYHFVKGELKIKLIDRATSYLKPLKVNKNMNTKLMDI
jgi:hypothetical protein